MQNTKISIILVSYNTKDLTNQAIHSIYEKTKNINFEIIVIDNNSHDETVCDIKKNFKEVILIENPVNSGFGVANNIASEIAQGEYLFFLNTDTILLNNAIKILSDFLDLNPNIGAAAGNLYNLDLHPATSINRVFPGILNEIDLFFFNLLSKVFFQKNVLFNHSNSAIVFKGNLSGADLMIRKDLFDAIGKFDNDFFMYYEETELLHRVCEKGYFVASIPEAMIIHLEGASENKMENSYKRSFKSKWIYLRKVKNKYIRLIHLIFQLTAFQRIILFSIFKNSNKVNDWKMIKKIENESFKQIVAANEK